MSVVFLALAHAHVPDVFITNASEDWCAAIEAAKGGDYVMLEPGDYTGPCDVVSKVSDPPGEVTIVQSLDPGDPARIHHDGVSPYILSLEGDVGLFLDLDFGEVPEGAVAVELRDGADLGVRTSRFSGPGTGVLQVGAITKVGVRDCEFTEATGVVVDLGCDGACRPASVEVSNNVVDGGSPSFQVDAESLTMVDNVVLGVAGDPFRFRVDAGVVERNTLEADVPIRVDGDVLVASNVVFGEPELDGATVVGNTVVGRIGGAPKAVAHNAIVGGEVGPDDVACDSSCFVDLEGRDLYPAEGGPLLGAAVGLDLDLDWCGRAREGEPTAGAFAWHGAEGSPGPVVLQFKSRVDCRLPRESLPADTSADTGGTPPPEESGGCGCGVGSGPSGWIGLVFVAAVPMSRRRRGPVR